MVGAAKQLLLCGTSGKFTLGLLLGYFCTQEVCFTYPMLAFAQPRKQSLMNIIDTTDR